MGLIDVYDGLVELYNQRDTRLEALPLAGSPLTPTIVLLAYVVVVFVIGPRFMRNRPAYAMRTTILVYNALQVAFNAYAVFWCIRHAIQNWSTIECVQTNADNAFGAYVYYINKYADLIETPIFVLRKKTQQVSFLHVYHHIMVVSCSYITLVVQPGGHILFYGFMNCLVHAVMYTYYFLSTYDRRALARSHWMTKKNVTKLQLIQFVLVSLHLAIPSALGYCNYSRFLTKLGLFQCTVMLVLFSNFYIRSYVVNSNKASPKVKDAL